MVALFSSTTLRFIVPLLGIRSDISDRLHLPRGGGGKTLCHIYLLSLSGWKRNFFSNSLILHSRWKRIACTTSSPSVRSWSWKGWQRRQSTLPPRLTTKFLSRHLANTFNQKIAFSYCFLKMLLKLKQAKTWTRDAPPCWWLFKRVMQKNNEGKMCYRKCSCVQRWNSLFIWWILQSLSHTSIIW